MSKLENIFWEGNGNLITSYDSKQCQQILMQFNKVIYAIKHVGLAIQGNISAKNTEFPLIGLLPAFGPSELGNRDFIHEFGLKFAYMSGAMANGIASIELVISMAKAGFLGSFGAAGLSLAEIEKAIQSIQLVLGTEKSYAFNLIHSPKEPLLEKNVIELYLKNNIHLIEASAFLDVSENIVRYRAAGLSERNGKIIINNKIIAKVSRPEVAEKFMLPAPDNIAEKLLLNGLITLEQKMLLQRIPLVDAITVEADSGGHTDNRPLITLLPQIIYLRNQIISEKKYHKSIYIGAAGGISTPQSVVAAFILGADYVVTGSINQATIEAYTSLIVKNTLMQVKAEDTIMAPAADMFEMGVNVQVLKKATMYPMRAKKLYALYNQYESIDQIPEEERVKLETQLFRKSLNEIWLETKQFFSERDPQLINQAEQNSKQKMALIFRWYLGQSSSWAKTGIKDRALDYQIWCGPSQAAFNRFAEETYLANLENRKVAVIALELMTGAAYLARLNMLKAFNVDVNVKENYLPSLEKSLKHAESIIA